MYGKTPPPTSTLISPSFEGRIYRIIQEALTNISKHSEPKKVNINLELDSKQKELEIKIFNDGIIQNSNAKNGVGLLGMMERVKQMKGIINFKKKNYFEIHIVLKLNP